jgi:TonB family protein
MLCPKCGKQTPLYKKSCVHCNYDLTQISVEDLLSETSLDSLEKELDSMASERGLFLGDRIAGRYQIKALIGRGSFGAVYRAQDLEAGDLAAVKVLHEKFFREGGDAMRGRLTADLERVRGLQHPNLVALRDVIFEKGLVLLVFDHVVALPLSKLIRAKEEKSTHFDLDFVLDVFRQLHRVLSFVHPVTGHGNLTPDNVLIRKDLVKVTDLGIACGLLRDIPPAIARTFKGREYRAPEAIDAPEMLGPRADVYSLGAILFHMLNLTAPSASAEYTAAFDGRYPAALRQIIGAAMAERPEARYADVESFFNSLSNAAAAAAPVPEEIAVFDEVPAEEPPIEGEIEPVDVFDEPMETPAVHFGAIGDGAAARPADIAPEPAVPEPSAPEPTASEPPALEPTVADIPAAPAITLDEFYPPVDPSPAADFDASIVPVAEAIPMDVEVVHGRAAHEIIPDSLPEVEFLRAAEPAPAAPEEGETAIRRPEPLPPVAPRSTVSETTAKPGPFLDVRPRPLTAPPPPPRATAPRATSSALPYLVAAVLTVLAIAAGAVYYFVRVRPSVEPPPAVTMPQPPTPVAVPEPPPVQPAPPPAPAPPPQSADDRKRERVRSLIEKGDRFFAQDALTSPPGANALDQYRAALSLDPGNVDAVTRVTRVERRYLAFGDRYFTAASFDRAIEFYRRALAVNPGSVLAKTKLDAAEEAKKRAAKKPETPPPAKAETPPQKPETPPSPKPAAPPTPEPEETVNLNKLGGETPAPPKPQPPAPRTKGTINIDEVRAVIKDHMGRIQVCLNEEITKNPDAPPPTGEIRVQFTIGSAGQVTATRIASSTLNKPQVENCVLRRFARMQFPKPQGGDVTIVFPIVFKE